MIETTLLFIYSSIKPEEEKKNLEENTLVGKYFAIYRSRKKAHT